jgi:sugar-specific transcriptional regulator TrmB
MGWDRAVEQLRAVGMSGYEAKAYLALLSAGQPLNGYEVAKASAVPRSTVYETLAKLVARGAAFEVHVDDPDQTAYLALPAESLLSRLRREFDESIDGLSRVLPEVLSPTQASLVQNIRGRTNVLARARDVIASASDDLFVSLWATEASELDADLRAAVRRGVDVSYISFGDAQPIGNFYTHQFSSADVVLSRVGARLFVVAGDRRSVVIGGVVGDETWAIWSDDPAVVLVAVEFVRHDIAMQVLVDRLGAETVEAFWHQDEHLERLQTGRGAPGLPSTARRAVVGARRRSRRVSGS